MKHLLLIVSTLHMVFAVNWQNEGLNPGVEIYSVNRSIVQKIYQSHHFLILPSLQSNQAYIVLKTNNDFEVLTYTIFYWINSTDEKLLFQTINVVSKLWFTLRLRTPLFDVPIIKEIYDYESPEFRSFFHVNKHTRDPMRRLYRVVFFNGQFHILQTLPIFRNINEEDTFVLDTGSLTNYIFNTSLRGSSSTPENINISIENKKALAAFRLSNFINENRNVGTTIFIMHKSSYDEEVNQFFSLISEVPCYKRNIAALFQGLHKNMWIIPQTNYVLFEFHIPGHPELFKPDYPSKLLIVNFFKVDACYVLLNYEANEAFVYVGKYSLLENLQAAMWHGELSALKNKMVLSVVHSTNLPAGFVIAFDYFHNLFFKEPEKINEYIKNSFKN